MAVIKETLILEDKLSNAMLDALQVCNRMADALDDLRYSAANIETASASAAIGIDRMAGAMEEATQKTESTTSSGNSLLGTVKRLAGAFASFETAKWLVNTSDQMTQLNANIIATDENGDITGPALSMHLTKEDVLAVGSTLNYRGADSMIRMQKEHMAGDPNKIPLAGMMDVIHGCRTIYPVPLALGCTFEPELVEKLCAMAAKEATAYGIQATFAPMADLARDAELAELARRDVLELVSEGLQETETA